MPKPSLDASRKSKKTPIGDLPLDWTVKPIRAFAKLRTGGTPARSKNAQYFNGSIPWVKTGDLNNANVLETDEKITGLGMKDSSCSLISPNTVLVAMYGGFNQIGRTGLLKIEAATNQAICAIIHEESLVQPEFLQHWLNYSVGMWRAVAGSSRKDPNISKGEVGSFLVPIPSLEEQGMIAKVLGSWDKALEGLEQLIAAKKQLKHGLMQQLLTGKRRFTKLGGGRWLACNLCDAFDRVRRPLTSEPTEVLSITARVGFVTQKEKFSKVIAGKTLEKYILLGKGEFAYNKGNSKAYPQGCIYMLESFEKAAVPQVYICFAAKSSNINAEFYKYYFESGLLNGQLMAIIKTGVRNDGLLNLDAEDFFKIRIHVPHVKEQREIVKLFRALNNEITSLQKEGKALRLQKKGLMQKLLTGKVRVTHLLTEST